MKRGRPPSGGTSRNSAYYVKKFRPSKSGCQNIKSFFQSANNNSNEIAPKNSPDPCSNISSIEENNVSESESEETSVEIVPTPSISSDSCSSKVHTCVSEDTKNAQGSEPEMMEDCELDMSEAIYENISTIDEKNISEQSESEETSVDNIELSDDDSSTGLTSTNESNRPAINQKYIASYEKTYNWLYYSHSANGFLCKVCSFMNNSGLNKPWESIGVDIKKGRHPTRVLQKHEGSKKHRQAVITQQCRTKEGILKNICKNVDAGNAAKIDFNRKLISKFIQILYFMVKQQWAISENFESLVTFLGESLDDNEIKKHLQTCGKNATYLSHISVKSLLNSISVYLEQKLLVELSCADFFALMADESTDESQREQLGIIVRYRLPGDDSVKEKYLGLINLRSNKAESITSALEKISIAKNIKLSNCLFIALDGCNVMSGEHSGVQRRIRHISPHCICINCRNHKLALVFVHLLKKYTELKSVDSLLISLWKMFHYSPKKFEVFKEIQQNVYGVEVLKIMKVSTTRWLSHGHACQRIASRYEQLIDTLDSLFIEAREPELKGLREQLLEPNILLTILFLADFLGKVDILNLWLQSPDITFSLLNAKVNLLIKEVDDYCAHVEEGNYFQMSSKLLNIATDCTSLSMKMRGKKQKSTENILIEFKEHFVKKFLNDFKKEIYSSFELSPNSCTLKGFDIFSNGNLNALTDDEVDFESYLSILVTYYGEEKKDTFKDSICVSKAFIDKLAVQDEKDNFKKEIMLAKMTFDIEKTKKAQKLLQENKKEDAKKALDKKMSINDFQMLLEKESSKNWTLYPNFMKLLTMCTIIPTSTASVERLFSRMNLVCTDMRSSLKQESLDEQLRILINGPKKLSPNECEEIVDIFRDSGNRRLLL